MIIRSKYMRIYSYIFLIISAYTISYSETKGLNIDSLYIQPGVVITFDDDFVNEWDDMHKILEKYHWKATFFVSHFDQLTPEEIEKLKALQNYGHEIGGHGLYHLDAVKYISECGKEDYLSQEIFPMVNIMKAHSLHITSFAYPFGSRNEMTDNILLEEFKILRGTKYGKFKPILQNCYYDNSRIVSGLGIDNSYPQYSIKYFLSLLEYASNNNKIVIFYAHRPVRSAQDPYETDYQTLIEICEYVKSNNLKFYTISELADIF
jgi:peptidoglycan-N-acetylglucosamine deacetylase